ncbi:uncharacterized protein LOC101215215 [Cucumis sativus]|uniref:Late embryogenesis abundant protein LEA-2 subgroup domain-containing protein n=1 Tax=Cucumis sativus TaxID=3659 RepID=A0A0A0K4T2_CUCSA|nr:uncharacterized protein LOC101215215 [Cucumis sativus]KGN43297.1 hypothetical protein Csa_020295 [Cucumis sativus]
MHAKSYSEVTSVDQSSPARSPRRPLYYVQSPSNHDVEKMSYGSSPMGSPPHHFYHASPIHHSRESSTSRFSASLKINQNRNGNVSAWRKLHHAQDSDGDDEEDDEEEENEDRDSKWNRKFRLYLILFLFFILLFTVFSLILWGASKSFHPQILIQSMVFSKFNVQAGSDPGGVATDLMSLNSTVRISYKNPATFFGVHVSSTPIQLHYLQLQVASGQMEEFYQKRQSSRRVVTSVAGHQVPLYGGISAIGNWRDQRQDGAGVEVSLNLTVAVRSRAYILGRLVKSTFHTTITCPITLSTNKLGKSHSFNNTCIYN